MVLRSRSGSGCASSSPCSGSGSGSGSGSNPSSAGGSMLSPGRSTSGSRDLVMSADSRSARRASASCSSCTASLLSCAMGDNRRPCTAMVVLGSGRVTKSTSCSTRVVPAASGGSGSPSQNDGSSMYSPPGYASGSNSIVQGSPYAVTIRRLGGSHSHPVAKPRGGSRSCA